MKLAVELPPVARIAVSSSIGIIGFVIFIVSLLCLLRAAGRQEKLHLSTPLPANSTKSNTNGFSPSFQNPTLKNGSRIN